MGNEDLIRGPRWRTRTTPERRRRSAVVTFVVVLVPGIVMMGGAIWTLSWAGAPAWVAALPWVLPTLLVTGWSVLRPSPAEPTDEDEQTWPGFAIRYVLVGEGDARPTPLRIIAAIVFGGPIGWSVFAFGGAVVAGLT